MRQVKKLTDFLIQIMAKKKESSQREIKNLIDQSLHELTGGKSEEFNELSLKETLDVLKHKGKLDAELAVVIADILFERIALLDQKDAEHCSSQALLLYKIAIKDSDVAFPLQSIKKIRDLNKKLNDSEKLHEVNKILQERYPPSTAAP